MKKKLLILSILSATSLIVTTNVCVFNNTLSLAKGECEHNGYHYDEVMATSESYGHMEHYTCCNCHEIFTTKPASGTFVDAGSGSAQSGDFDPTVTYQYVAFDKQGGIGGTDSLNNVVINTTLPAITIPTKEGYVFNGYFSEPNGGGNIYYDNNGSPVITFKTSTVSTTLYANWVDQEDIDRGVIPTISSDGKYITYGMYPQTNVNDSTLISALDTLTNPNEYGYYFYNNYYYSKYTATPGDTGYTFDNGTTIVKRETYWFKVEPIKWTILENVDGTYFITAESLLVNYWYNDSYDGTESRTDYQGNADTVYTNNYKYSDIRSWLNTDFYNQAFFLDYDNIQTSIVDNSGSSTGNTSNEYACEDTSDKLFVLSYKELTSTEYGFSSSYSVEDVARQCRTTDYARAHGAYTYSSSSYQNNGCYFSRSPYFSFSYIAGMVIDTGYFTYLFCVNGSGCGVRPALRLSIA